MFPYSADGAEMGKLTVAEGLGITVLADFNVIGDPLETRGVITSLARDHIVRYQVHTNVARTDALLLIMRVQASKIIESLIERSCLTIDKNPTIAAF